VHKNSKACVASYPCVVQNNILWFYPRAEPEHKDVLQRKPPPLVPEIDDPEFVTVYGTRDLPYGYRLKHFSESCYASAIDRSSCIAHLDIHGSVISSL